MSLPHSGYTVGDVESGLRHLRDVLSVASEIQFQLAIGEKDDRVDTLLWLADGIARAVYSFHEERGEGGNT